MNQLTYKWPSDMLWAIPEERFWSVIQAANQEPPTEPPECKVSRLDDIDNTHPEAAALGLPRTDTTVAVVPIYGVINQRSETNFWGDTSMSTDVLSGVLGELIANPNIGAVVLDIASPGGTVPGTPELAAQIRQWAKQKPIYGIANSEAASGAYWLASQATKLFVTPSGSVGSVGVFIPYVNEAGYLEKLGIDVEFVSAGKYKVELTGLGPLTDEARAALKARVDEVYGMMVEDIARGRGRRPQTVRNEFGEGRLVGAARALEAGMVDGIATLPELLSQIVPRKSRGSRRASVLADSLIEEMED